MAPMRLHLVAECVIRRTGTDFQASLKRVPRVSKYTPHESEVPVAPPFEITYLPSLILPPIHTLPTTPPRPHHYLVTHYHTMPCHTIACHPPHPPSTPPCC